LAGLFKCHSILLYLHAVCASYVVKLGGGIVSAFNYSLTKFLRHYRAEDS
jgi:hypothetical protein